MKVLFTIFFIFSVSNIFGKNTSLFEKLFQNTSSMKVQSPDNHDCCDSDVPANNPVNVKSKSSWNALPLKKDASFPCMDYPSMAKAMGYPKGLSEEEVVERVYKDGRILIHHSSNNYTAKQNQRYHINNRGLQDLAYHFFVTKDGDILEGRPLSLMGAHAGTLQRKHYSCQGKTKVAYISRDYDFRSIGIVLQGNFEVEEIPDAQYGAVRSLVHVLVTRYGISKVNGHHHYKPGGTSCPGAKLIAKMKEIAGKNREPKVDKTTNSIGPDFICRYPSSSCK